jgi:hypothetical protein
MVEERGGPFLLPVPCDVSYSVQRQLRCRSGPVPGAGLLVSIPLVLAFASPAPRPVARLCSSPSQLQRFPAKPNRGGFDGVDDSVGARDIRLPPGGGAARNFRILASRLEQDQNPESAGALCSFARLSE